MKYLLVLLLMLGLALPITAQRQSRGSGRTDVHVGGYYRKNGTYVQPHYRAVPGFGNHSSSHSSRSYSSASSYTPRTYSSHSRSYTSSSSRHSSGSSVSAGTHRGTTRSRAARDSFQRANPCPSTGKRSGACPGYVVDHVKPLACGGGDVPSNMEWQTVTTAKAKDKTERIGCR
jgi:hypothetical protein